MSADTVSTERKRGLRGCKSKAVNFVKMLVYRFTRESLQVYGKFTLLVYTKILME